MVNDQGRVSSGESVLDAQAAMKKAGASAMFFNCSQVYEVTAAMEAISGKADLPLGGYAQGAIYDGHGWDFHKWMSTEEYAAFTYSG